MSIAVESTATTTTVPPFEITGAPTAPVVVVLGGISAVKHVCSNEFDRSPGWWECFAGAGKYIDTTRHRVVGFDYIDGGSDERGRPARVVTTHDQADALAAVLDHLGVDCAHAVIGASYGGMVALAFAERYPDRLDSLAVIGAAHVTHPMTTARRVIQRRIVELGVDTGRDSEGLALARALGVTTYRSATEFGTRFAASPIDHTATGAVFPVEQYLDHQGATFAARWQPARFLALSLSSDLHAVDPRGIRTPATLVAIEDDGIVPREHVDELARTLGGPVRVRVLHSTNGHDAFLTEHHTLGPILADALLSIPPR